MSVGEGCYTIETARKAALGDTVEGRAVRSLASIAALCNDATFGDNTPSGGQASERRILGDATGNLLLFFGMRNNLLTDL